jgi:hypothetical protein
MKHLIDPAALRAVLTSQKNNHGAEFTTVSKKTGKDYTFKLSRSEYKGKWYTHVRVEVQYQEYKYLGSYFNGRIYHKGQTVLTDAAVAIAWILERVEGQRFEVLAANVEVFHLGACLKCGKTLTDATSIEIGLGPICRGHN